MATNVERTVLGITLTLITVGLVIPLTFWAAAYGLDIAFGWNRILGRPSSDILAAAAVLIGIFWVTWAYSYLHFVGKGVPFEVFGYELHPTCVLVTTGPYAYMRNPMVFGMLFMLLGVAFFRGSWGGWVLLPVVVTAAWLYLVIFEEKGLAARFGADYQEYRRNVPLLIPRLRPYVHEAAPAS